VVTTEIFMEGKQQITIKVGEGYTLTIHAGSPPGADPGAPPGTQTGVTLPPFDGQFDLLVADYDDSGTTYRARRR